MEADKISVVIKSLGSWSQKLYKQLASNSVEHIQVSVEGPYGPTASHFMRSAQDLKESFHSSLDIIVAIGSNIRNCL